MKNEMIRQFSKFIEDWVPEEASIAIAGGDKYVTYIPGRHDIQINQGQPVPSGSITERVYEHKSRVESLVDESVFGLPYYGVGYPLEDTDAGFNGALTVILPPEYSLRKPAPLSYIIGKSEDFWTPIAIEEVVFIESHQKKTVIYTEEGSYIAKHPLKTLEQRLPDTFIRIHRSYIVNIAYVKRISRDLSSNLEVTLKGVDTAPLMISQTYVQRVRKVLGF